MMTINNTGSESAIYNNLTGSPLTIIVERQWWKENTFIQILYLSKRWTLLDATLYFFMIEGYIVLLHELL